VSLNHETSLTHATSVETDHALTLSDTQKIDDVTKVFTSAANIAHY